MLNIFSAMKTIVRHKCATGRGDGKSNYIRIHGMFSVYLTRYFMIVQSKMGVKVDTKGNI